MAHLAELQQQFMQVLQGSHPDDFANELVQQGNLSTLTRIDIYRNAYHMRLQESIETDHEMLGYYLGDALFGQMVTGYIAAYPSKQTSLRYFCEQLPDFLTHTTPFNAHPILAELARFERTLLTAFDAPDAGVATLTQLTETPAQDWPYLHFRLHPSVQHYRADYNAVEIWQALKQQQTPPAIKPLEHSWLVWRNMERLTEFSSLNTSETIMLQSLIQELNYADLCEQLSADLPIDTISETSLHCLINWLNLGVISRITIESN